ncbi:MAG TPA: biotin/lipoyl-containing protein, partial [Amycolatopsis sp.]|nr:biotin/lipoyl-containing protein [Amycolatopsis sp.]
GGGKGMRIAHFADEVAEGFARAKSEAASSFGDDRVFIEKFITDPRHIEIQVLGDKHGNVIYLGERECSIQRRHQKVVEEAPSPFVDEAMREALFDAARKAAQAIAYVGAGTVEFLAGPDGRFYFLEMNTRLQVEHPVTEATTGLDLVSLQLRIAEGEHLPIEEPETRGHAIEVRLYAEDPAEGWQPQSGILHRFEVPAARREFEVGPGVRLDSGFVSGQTVGVHYDPMLAKVIAYAPDRRSAARALAGALAGAEIHGVVTNRDLLVNVLRHEAFLAGETDTAFFGRHGLETLARPLATVDAVRISALAAALAGAAANRSHARVQGRLPSGWRNVHSQGQRKRFRTGDDEIEVVYTLGRDGLRADGFEGVGLHSAESDGVVLEVSGVRRKFAVARYGDTVYVDSPEGAVELGVVPRYTDPDAALAAGSLVAPMPGTVVRLAVEAGDTVKTGDPLLWLEAMKMEHRIAAPADGVVTELPVVVGQQVEVGTILAVVGDNE